MRTRIPISAILTLVLLAPWRSAVAQQPPEGFPDLVSGIKSTPGVLGVETAITPSNMQVIFAWFEDRTAALAWYYSEMHQLAQNRFLPDRQPHEPLAHLKEHSGPILAIASLTWAEESQHEGMELNVSQIAIELYAPLPGGVYVGGRFAPASMKVDHMRDYTPKSP